MITNVFLVKYIHVKSNLEFLQKYAASPVLKSNSEMFELIIIVIKEKNNVF